MYSRPLPQKKSDFPIFFEVRGGCTQASLGVGPRDNTIPNPIPESNKSLIIDTSTVTVAQDLVHHEVFLELSGSFCFDFLCKWS